MTLGLAAVVHHHLVNRELRDFGIEVRPWLATLALAPGGLLLIPALVTLWRTASRVAVAQETVGLRPTSRGALGAAAVVLWLFAPYHQRELNRVWEVES